MNNVRTRVVEDASWGVYVWRTDEGKLFGDSEGNVLSIAANKNDLEKIRQLTDAARYWGAPPGKPYFLAGHRKITDEEHEEQKMRMQWGLLPDPLDIGAIKDEAVWRQQYGR